MGHGMSTRTAFYSRFVPRVVDHDDLAAHCNDMIHELDEGRDCACVEEDECAYNEAPVRVRGDYDYWDDEDEMDEYEAPVRVRVQVISTEAEDTRKDARSACIDARIALGLGSNDTAFDYHTCSNLYRAWKHMRGAS
jgi:hypothetical protein